MASARAAGAEEKWNVLAYALPMFSFAAFLALNSILKAPGGPLWRTAPEFWIYPLQTLLCAGLLFYFRRAYELHSLGQPFFAASIGLLVFGLWIAPQQFFGFSARVAGFNPDLLAAQPALYWTTVGLRFLRLVVVVPLVEEIFWRGFLLRYLISERFTQTPVGAFSWLSFSVVALGFCFSHDRPDRPAALITGVLYNLVAYRTKSLGSCVLAHGLTNFALGLWVMATKQWGFW